MARSKYTAEQRAIVNSPVGRKSRVLMRNVLWAERHLGHSKQHLRDVNRGIAAFRHLRLLADVLHASANDISRNRSGSGDLSFSDGELMRNAVRFAGSIHDQRRGIAGLITKDGDGPLINVRNFATSEVKYAEDGLDAALWRSYRHYADNREAYFEIGRVEMEVAGIPYNDGSAAQPAAPAT